MYIMEEVLYFAAILKYMVPQNADKLTTGHGCPLSDKLNSLTVGERGPILLQDIQLLDEMAHFDRERIPERVVHAKGAGQWQTFACLLVSQKYE